VVGEHFNAGFPLAQVLVALRDSQAKVGFIPQYGQGRIAVTVFWDGDGRGDAGYRFH
jgi:hypothetical protein